MNNTLVARTDSIEPLEPRRLLSTVTVAPVEVVASNAPQPATFTATLDAPSTSPTKLFFSTENASAKAGLDYRQISSHIVIPAGTSSAKFSVQVLPSTVTEPDRSFFVRLRTSPGNAVSTDKTSVTIIESSTPPTVTVSDATVMIGIHKVTMAKFFVGLTNRTASPVTVHYSTQDVTALAGTNYFPGSGLLTIAPFKTGGIIKLKIVGDAIVKPDKVFDVNISSATNAHVPAGLFSRVVIEDSVPGLARPSLTVSNPSAVRGNNVNFVLTLSAPSANDVTVRFFTTDITTNTTQYTPTAGILTIPAGQTTATISVPTRLSSTINNNTQLRLVLSAPANANLVGNNAIGTILAFPSITINDSIVDEANAAPLKPITFTATLDAPSPLPVTFTYNTATGGITDTGLFENAVAGTDFATSSATLTFQPGQTSITFTIPVLPDNFSFGDQIFVVNASGAINGILIRPTGIGTIQNLDQVVGTPAIDVDDPTATIRNSQTGLINFTVTLDAASTLPISVHFATVDGTALAGVDYTATSGTLVFNPGETAKLVSVPIFGASATSTDVDFELMLTNPINATINTAIGNGTISELGIGL